MKYMGSKSAMLKNGLADVLDKEVRGVSRFVDLLSGSGAVAIHVAQKKRIPVWANDLQSFSSVLSGAVILRRKKVDSTELWRLWYRRAHQQVRKTRVPTIEKINWENVHKLRRWCKRRGKLPVTKAYGGHYFSAEQAVWIDALRQSLPLRQPHRTVALAALIHSASKCVAAPGHTAQPFQPTRTARPFLWQAWKIDVREKTKEALIEIAALHARRKGAISISDAKELTGTLTRKDIVFIDPPYSGVHYSRFYHVLETIARGQCGVVSGTGRYPKLTVRPRSSYSVMSESREALDDLLSKVSQRRAKVILTFPSKKCSNGLSGRIVRNVARQYFSIRVKRVESTFSTLGGNNRESKNGNTRHARQSARELILVMRPRKKSVVRSPRSKDHESDLRVER